MALINILDLKSKTLRFHVVRKLIASPLILIMLVVMFKETPIPQPNNIKLYRFRAI